MEDIPAQLPDTAMTLREVDDHRWTFEYPRLSWEVLEGFHEAIDLWHAGQVAAAEDRYRQLTTDFPEFIDAYHHLALLLDASGREQDAFELWQATVKLGMSCFPDSFSMARDRLPWVILDNRPFLRAYHALGLEYLARDEVQRALSIFDDILSLNPNDNQGVRALAVDCYFRLRRPEKVLQICERYPDDGMEQLVYGQVLALYQLGRTTEARRALREAVNYLPLVAKELTKRRHFRPRDLHPDHIAHGGADQAYYYWTEHGPHWQNTPGAIAFVRDYLGETRGFVNRALLVVRPKPPYIEWARQVDAEAADFPPSLFEKRRTAYLVREIEFESDIEPLLLRHHPAIFEQELEAWMLDEATWPEQRDLATFKQWFEVEVFDMVFDLEDTALYTEVW